MDINVGFLMFENLEELDLVGPWEMMSVWGKEFNGPNNIFTLSEKGGAVKCAHGLRIDSDYSFSNCPLIDYLFIPGGMGTRTQVDNPVLIEFIQSQAKHNGIIVSVCTGTFLLQAAGLLNGRKVSTHWASINRLKQFPELIVKEQRFVKDDNIWTSAGISAGMDMTLAFIAEVAGTEVAGKVQMQTEYFPDHKRHINLADKMEIPAYLK